VPGPEVSRSIPEPARLKYSRSPQIADSKRASNLNYVWFLQGGTIHMRKLAHQVAPLVWKAALVFSVVASGCTVHAGYYDDPYYHDHHQWSGEVVYYNQWEHDTHRDHVEFKKRSKDDQKSYWDWRHSHDDHH
jgi:hypothetical protein